ncbi:MAG: type II toxin-antitoxin system RelE/ParE family toxin [Gemmatimonadota bacterium]|nr:type II toxin-antitoxin system RelE/ParE family toxin [Gemmatimonadota bacterium]
MIRSFRDKGTEDIFNGENSKAASKVLPSQLHLIGWRKLNVLNYTAKLEDLRIPRANRLEPLKGNREGQHSIRINDQFRICFRWTGNDAEDVEITDYH